MSLLSARNITKTYTIESVETQALRGLSLEVEAGEFTALAGPSGSGKSTLLHLIGGLDRPSSGEIRLENRRIDQLERGALAKIRLDNLGFVFQAYNLIPVLTALENAAFVLELRGEAKEKREQKALEALKVLGLEDFADRKPNQLSGGQQQRVAVARALAAEPKIILADEPTANLDSKTSIALIEHLQELNVQRGVTFLFSSHDPRLLERVNRIIYMEDGMLQREERMT